MYIEQAHSDLFNRISGQIKFIFETILDYESGDQMGSFDAKNRNRKSHAWAPLTGWFSVQWKYVLSRISEELFTMQAAEQVNLQCGKVPDY